MGLIVPEVRVELTMTAVTSPALAIAEIEDPE